MQRHGDRSRSPTGGNSEWISRTVAQFARYSHKRPQGLSVDSTGAFLVSNLMSAWGDTQGLTAQAIIAAVEKHMYRGSEARFEILHEPRGDVTIRCKQKGGGQAWGGGGGGGGGYGASNGSADQWGGGGSGSSWQAGGATASAPKQNGKEDWKGQSWESDKPQWKDAKAWEEKKEEGKAWEQKKDGAAWWKKDDAWQADKPAADAWQGSGGSSNAGGGGGGAAWKAADPWQAGDKWASKSGGGSEHRGDAEKVQRWVGYVLKSGSGEVGVDVDSGGWARLDELADVLAKQKPDFGVSSVADLEAMFSRENDPEGRFEVDSQGRVRKLSRHERGGGGSAGAWGAGGAAEGGHASPWSGPGRQSQSSAKAAGSSANAWEGSPGGGTASVWDPPATPEGEAPAATGPAPDPPPGPEWTEYVDDGVFWWYYEGPLGKWWMQEHDDRPRPWAE